MIPKALPRSFSHSDKGQGASQRFISIMLWMLNSWRRAREGIGWDG